MPQPPAVGSTLLVLFEDDHLIVVDKPAGVVVHPTYKNAAGTLLDALRSYASAWPDSQNPTIVGRLDKLTSGIVVVAKRADVHAALQRVLAAEASEKDYLAIVQGHVTAAGTIELRLSVDRDDRRRMMASTTAGRPGTTSFERLACAGGRSLLRCRIGTGRRHQIRAHLSACGWPIVGDAVYGAALAGFARHALHSWRVAFTHPVAGHLVHIESPIPRDLQELMDASALRLEIGQCRPRGSV